MGNLRELINPSIWDRTKIERIGSLLKLKADLEPAAFRDWSSDNPFSGVTRNAVLNSKTKSNRRLIRKEILINTMLNLDGGFPVV